MTDTMTIGERIAWYRRRRGMSQRVLADMVSRTEDWLNKIENNRIQLDRVSVIQSIATQLDVSLGDLLAEPTLVDNSRANGRPTVPALREALLSYTQLMPFTRPLRTDPKPLSQLEGRLSNVWDAYQSSHFAYVSAALPQLINDLDTTARSLSGMEREKAETFLASAYHASATVLTKIGETDLAWVAAQRGFDIAQRVGEPTTWLSLTRSVAHVMLSSGRNKDATQLIQQVAEHSGPIPAGASPTYLSVYGTMFLTGAMASARADDRSSTRDFLEEASAVAARLGRDANHAWTAFGPTNVEIHRVCTAMELDDIETALTLGPQIDTSPLPIERQIRHMLELARAQNARSKRDAALSLVLQAEARAPEQVRHHSLCRDLVITWIRTTRTKPSLDLSGLAQRIGVV